MKRRPGGWRKTLRSQSVACYFTKPSTRTRVSVEAAVHRLGALPIMLRPDELQLGRGEPIADTARVLSSYCAAIVIRTFAQADVEAVAAASTVPVINALTDEHHPCQALADLLTLREHFGQLEDVAVAYIGDGNNVAHSLMEAGALAGMDIRVACPPGYEPDAEILARAPAPRRVRVVHDPHEAVEGAHAVYTDVWVSMGDEAEQERRLAELAPLPGHAGADGAGGRRARCSCTACPPTAARRSRPRSSTARSRSCSRRPPTACRPSRPSSTPSSPANGRDRACASSIALGGNALLRRGEPADAERQRRNVATAVAAHRRPGRATTR